MCACIIGNNYGLLNGKYHFFSICTSECGGNEPKIWVGMQEPNDRVSHSFMLNDKRKSLSMQN